MAEVSTRSHRSESGVASVEFIGAMSVVLLIFFAMLQYAVRAEADRVLKAAAEEGAVATARYDGTETQGHDVADDYIERLDSHLSNRHVVAHRGARTATVTVAADAIPFIPLINVHLTATARAPIERFVP